MIAERVWLFFLHKPFPDGALFKECPFASIDHRSSFAHMPLVTKSPIT